jgi:sugar lactone lactonase YvrE
MIRFPAFALPRVVAALLAVTALLVAAAGPAVAAAPGPSRIDLPNGWSPEGITAGPGTTVYVGSLANGAIYQADVRTGDGSVLVDGIAGKVGVGVEYDADANRIWVVGGPTGEVRVYDASSGSLLETYAFSPAGFLNDLVVTEDAVYVTDSGIQQLDVIPLGAGGALPDPADVETLPLTGDGLAFDPAAFNANGIVEVRGWLIVVQSNTGQLWRVDPATGDATEISLGDGVDVAFGDGLEVHGNTLYVVQNQLNRVEVFRLGAGLGSASLQGILTSSDPGAPLDVPTTAAFVTGSLYVVNARFNTPPTAETPYWITRLPARP